MVLPDFLASFGLVPVPVKVVHIAYSADGGAGRAARRASAACNAAGMQSVFACVSGEDLDQTLTCGEIQLKADKPASDSAAQVLSHRLQWGLIPQMRVKDGGYSLFSIAYPGVDVTAHLAIMTADIVHLHWPTWTVTPPTIRRLLDVGKTVVVTLHDCWMFTGGCHYPSGCDQFTTACMKCPQISDRLGLASAGFEDKLVAYGGGHPRLHVVALCRWMRDLAASSTILGNAPTHLVPNPVETDLFTPDGRASLRTSMGVGDGDAVLLFGNFDNSETRKGSDILRAALTRLARSDTVRDFPGQIYLMSFGRNAEFEVPAPLKGINVGQISDDQVLAGIYSVADLLCFPSVEDNYPNSVVEAAACGTPSVAFSTGGMADMIVHGQTGLLVQPLGDTGAFTDALAGALGRLHGNQGVRDACRAHTLATNTMDIVGQQLAAVYAQALGRDIDNNMGADTGRAAPDTHMARLRDQVLSHVLLDNDDRLGSEFAKFPVSQFLRGNGVGGGAGTFEANLARPRRYAAPDRTAPRLRVLTVRSFHDHHSAHSGPYQFLRHLPPDRFELSNVLVPLGDDLVPDPSARARAKFLGQLIGAAPFGAQTNAWTGEWEIARRLRHEHFDLVHFIDAELSGWLITRLPDSFFHGPRPAMLAMLHQPEHLAAKWTSATGLARYDMLGAVAEQQTDWLRSFVPGVPVQTVPHGIDVDFFCPDPDPTPAPGNRPFRLLAVGHWLRDYDLAFGALDILAAAGMEIEYRVVCHSLNRPSLPPYVTLLSGLPDAELVREYRAADLVFMPLQAATANNALLEGMACGTPVVSTAVGGVGDYVDPGAGHLCPPDPEACAAVLRTLLLDPALRADMGARARAHALTFDWRHIGARYGAIYQALIEANRASQRGAA